MGLLWAVETWTDSWAFLLPTELLQSSQIQTIKAFQTPNEKMESALPDRWTDTLPGLYSDKPGTCMALYLWGTPQLLISLFQWYCIHRKFEKFKSHSWAQRMSLCCLPKRQKNHHHDLTFSCTEMENGKIYFAVIAMLSQISVAGIMYFFISLLLKDGDRITNA